MKEHKDKVFVIGVATPRQYKSGRDRLAGIQRYFRQNPEHKAVVIELMHDGKLIADISRDDIRPLDGTILFLDLPKRQWQSLMGNRFAKIACINDIIEKADKDIYLDDREIGETAARLFMRRGYSNFAYVACKDAHEATHSRERCAAFSETLSGGNFTCADTFTVVKNQKYRELKKLAEFLAAQPKPCAVLAYNDKAAQEVYSACTMSGLSIPDQIGVIGVDNETSICETLTPPLTSILPDFEKCGYIAAEMLMRKLLDPGARLEQRRYGVRAVFERESSMDVDGSARLVTRARAFIAAHYPEPLDVEAVAKHLGTCRRRLEIKFRKVTGGTVRDEIERTRLDNAKKLLANTNISVGEIAAASGFGAECTFRAAFARSERMSPRAYRKIAASGIRADNT